MIIPSPLDILLQHLTDTGIRYEKDEERNRHLALFPYPERTVGLAIEEHDGAISFHATLPSGFDAVAPERRPSVAELLHRLNYLTPRFVWLFDFDTGDVFCRTVVPTTPHTPKEADFQRTLSRLAIVLFCMIPSILAVAFEDAPPTDAAIKAELALHAAMSRVGLDAGTPAHRQPSHPN